MNEERLYKPAETAAKLGITTMLLNKWVQHFGVETEWSNPNNSENKGHRRYTEENMKVLLKIKEKVQEQNWSWDKTKAYLSGDETVDVQLRTGLESEVAELRKELALDREANQHFQESLIRSLSTLTNQLEELRKENDGLKLMLEQQQNLGLQPSDSPILSLKDFKDEGKRVAEEVVTEVLEKMNEQQNEQERQEENAGNEAERTKQKRSLFSLFNRFKRN